MRIFDAFIFNDELDLLELRLMELGDLVDTFVLCEMGHNFMCELKPLHFAENCRRFDKWLPKIRHVIVKNYPIEPHPALEHYQRRQIALGLHDMTPEDVLLLGDVDEIPSRRVLEDVRRLPPDHPFVCVQRLYYYYVNCQQLCMWPGTLVAPRFALPEVLDCQKIRADRHRFPQLQDAGWHFSWLGPLQNLQRKLAAIDVSADAVLYGTPEIVKPAVSDESFISHCLDTGADLFGRTDPYAQKVFVPIEPGVRQPKVIHEWLVQHPQYAKEVPYAHDESGVQA